jgi:RNA polymerase sigma-70 factor (ECF subfamily)
VHSRRRRFEPLDPHQSEQITTQFLTAAATGDLEGLIGMLAPDVVFTSDSAGKVSAARRPVLGPDKVARLIIGLMRQAGPEYRMEVASYNSAPALVVYRNEQPDSVFMIEFADGKITNFYAMRNPDKLAAATVRREISR